jgi:hypothetical protein
MPDDRNKNRQNDMDEVEQGGSQAPGRNPQGDKSTGGQQGTQDHRQDRETGDGGSSKEGGQNEQTRR